MANPIKDGGNRFIACLVSDFMGTCQAGSLPRTLKMHLYIYRERYVQIVSAKKTAARYVASVLSVFAVPMWEQW